MHTILFKIKMAFSWVFSGTTDVLSLIAQSPLSMAQTSAYFKHSDTCMFTYAIPTLIIEALCLATQVKLLLTTVTVN